MAIALVFSLAVLSNGFAEDEPDLAVLIKNVRDAIPSTELDSPVLRLAWNAMGEMAELGPRAAPAVPVLVQAMKKNARLHGAAYILEKIGQSAVPALKEAVRDTNREFAWAAADALLGIDPDSAIAMPEVSRFLKDNDAKVRCEALHRLRKVRVVNKDLVAQVASNLVPPYDGDGAASEAADTLEEFARISPKLTAMAIPQLISAIKAHRWTNPPALLQLGSLAVPALMELLDDGDKEVRNGALWTLGLIGKRAAAAAPKIQKLLRHKDAATRRDAVKVLGEINALDDDAIAEVAGLLEDKDHAVRHEVIETLLKLGPRSKSWAPALLRIMEGRDEKDLWTRFCAARALTAIGPVSPEVVTFLAQCLRDKNCTQRFWAAAALDQLGPAARPVLPTLVAVLKEPPLPLPEDTREADKAMFTYINELGYDKTRILIMETLVQVGADARVALPELRRLAREDKNKEVREAAKEAVELLISSSKDR